MNCRLYSFTRKNGRSDNQDYIFYEKKQFHENETIMMFGVCDGMGGMEKGNELSRLTAWTFCSYFSRFMAKALSKEQAAIPSSVTMQDVLSDAVNAVQKTMCSYMEKWEIRGGSTLTVGVIAGRVLYFVNAGDSPCYLINKKRESLELISDIENCAYEGLQNGNFTEKESPEFQSASSYLTNFIGSHRFRKPKVRSYPIFKDDLILMGSDGLFGRLDEQEIFQDAGSISTVKLLEKIADHAADMGERDNQSGIVCKMIHS